MNEIPFSAVDNFYTFCKECELWFEFYLKDEVIPQRPQYQLNDYDVTVRNLGGGKRFSGFEKKIIKKVSTSKL